MVDAVVLLTVVDEVVDGVDVDLTVVDVVIVDVEVGLTVVDALLVELVDVGLGVEVELELGRAAPPHALTKHTVQQFKN